MSSSTHWKDEKCKQYFGQKTWRGKTTQKI
jgi:hypothetical protein